MPKNKLSIFALGFSMALATAGFTGCSTWGGGHHDERSEGRVEDDQQITRAIKNSLDNEPVYKFNDVNVNTFAGIVQLSGFVNSEEQKQRAGELAQEVPGVTQVQNDLTLKPHVAKVTEPVSATGRTEPRIYSQPYNPDAVTQPVAPANKNP